MVAFRDVWKKNCGGLNNLQQSSLWQVLCEYKDIFAFNYYFAHLVQHHIDTGEALPIKVRPWHLPIVQQNAAEVEAMLEAGIMNPLTVHGSLG